MVEGAAGGAAMSGSDLTPVPEPLPGPLSAYLAARSSLLPVIETTPSGPNTTGTVSDR